MPGIFLVNVPINVLWKPLCIYHN